MRPMGLMWLMRLIGLMGHIGLMSLALMGCSRDSGEQEAAPGPLTETAISFSGQQGEEAVSQGARPYRAHEAYAPYALPGRRAGTPRHEIATSFEVWGYKDMAYSAGVDSRNQLVFPGYEVDWINNSAATTTTNSSGWEYILTSEPGQTIKYWDWGAAAYRFFAVTGSPAHEAHEPNGPHEFTFAADATNTAAAPYFTKLWFSTGAIDDYPDKQFGKPVQLEFMKPFTRVRFLFIYAYPREGILLENKCFKPTTDYTEVEGDKVKIATAATFTVTYPQTGPQTRESFAISDITAKREAFTVDSDPEDDSKEYPAECPEGWYTVLPNNTQGSYQLSVDVNKANRTCVVPAEYMQWQPGYSYTYIFKITEEGGVEIDLVQEAITNWTEMEGTHTVFNW